MHSCGWKDVGGVQGKDLLEAGQDHPSDIDPCNANRITLPPDHGALLKLSSVQKLIIQHHIWDARVKRGLEGCYIICVYIHHLEALIS